MNKADNFLVSNGFGEPAIAPTGSKSDWTNLAKRVCLVALGVLVGAVAGFFTAGPVGALIGGFIGAHLTLSVVLMDEGRNLAFKNKFETVLPDAHIYQDRAQVKIGQQSTCDLLVSNDVAKTFELKKSLIESAETSIELSPNFAGGGNFEEVLGLIEKQMDKKPRLRVHIIVSEDLLSEQNISTLKRLEERFEYRFKHLVTKRIFCTKPFLHTEENHVKMLVVDGKYFAVGGAGIHKKMTREHCPDEDVPNTTFAEKFIDKAFRDTDLIGEGAVAETMRAQFFALFRKWEKRMNDIDNDRFFAVTPPPSSSEHPLQKASGLRKDVKMSFFVGGPEHREKNPITEQYEKLIRESTQSIKIANLIFNPPEQLKQALKRKKEEGIQIEGFFNGTGENSSAQHYTYALPNRSNYALLNRAHEYERTNTLYHKKVATFDNKRAIIGSYNLGIKSAFCDDEIACVIEDEGVVKDINEGLEADREASEMYEGTSLTLKTALSYFQAQLAIAAIGPYFG